MRPEVPVCAGITVHSDDVGLAEAEPSGGVTDELVVDANRVTGTFLAARAAVIPTWFTLAALTPDRVRLTDTLARELVADRRQSLGGVTVTRLTADWIGRLKVEETSLASVAFGPYTMCKTRLGSHTITLSQLRQLT